jgi:hypothetical protein
VSQSDDQAYNFVPALSAESKQVYMR